MRFRRMEATSTLASFLDVQRTDGGLKRFETSTHVCSTSYMLGAASSGASPSISHFRRERADGDAASVCTAMHSQVCKQRVASMRRL